MLQPYSHKSTSGINFNDGTRLGMLKFIGTTNFDEISHSTAELLLLPACENRHLPY